jgi:hypothetical protein
VPVIGVRKFRPERLVQSADDDQQGLSDYTAPLADAFRVIRYQQRGLAPSLTSGPFEVGRHVADAVTVLDALASICR